MISYESVRIFETNNNSKKIYKGNFLVEKEMNKIKALLIAGLLSLSSVSFASTVTYTGSTLDHAGSISLISMDGGVTVGGIFGEIMESTEGGEVGTGVGSVYYDMTLDSGLATAVGSSFDVSTFTIFDVTLSIFDSLAFDAASLVGSGINSISASLDAGVTYYLQLTGIADTSYNVDVAAVPVPAAGILFASALFGAGVLGRRKKKSTSTSMVGAFTRAS